MCCNIMISDDIKYLPENEVVKEVYKNADGVFRVNFSGLSRIIR
jgi:hypothetical protein